jgi:hypothetical protein
MVSVGDVHRLLGHQPLHGVDRLRVAHRPHAVVRAVQFAAQRGFFRQALLQSPGHLVLRIRIESEDRTEIALRRFGQGQPVLLRPAERLLVRKHAALAERFDPQPGEEHLARIGAPFMLEALVIRVERGPLVAHQHAAIQPGFKVAPGLFIGLGRAGGLGRHVRQVDPYEVIRIAVQQPLLVLRVEHVVRWGQPGGDIA